MDIEMAITLTLENGFPLAPTWRSGGGSGRRALGSRNGEPDDGANRNERKDSSVHGVAI
jgi:hypothetical protein